MITLRIIKPYNTKLRYQLDFSLPKRKISSLISSKIRSHTTLLCSFKITASSSSLFIRFMKKITETAKTTAEALVTQSPKSSSQQISESSPTKVSGTPYSQEDLERAAKNHMLPSQNNPHPDSSWTMKTSTTPTSMSSDNPINVQNRAAQQAITTAQNHQQFGTSTTPYVSTTSAVASPNANTHEPFHSSVTDVPTTSFTAPTSSTGTHNCIVSSPNEEVPPLIEETEESYPVSAKPETINLVGIKLKEQARDAYGQQLPSHELGKTGHVLIGQKNQDAGIIVADHILTSSKKNHVTGMANPTIDTQNYKGESKPQRVAELQTGRMFLENDQDKTFEIEENATKYLQQSHIENKVTDIIENTPVKLRTVRPHVDDPELFTEDGVLHSDDENIQRGPECMITDVPPNVEAANSIKDDYDSSLFDYSLEQVD